MIPSLSPGNSVRFRVDAKYGRSSSVYMLWTSKNKGDVYLAYRDLASDIKISLHQSALWRMGFISYAAAEAWGFPAGQDRAMDKWEPPPDIFPGCRMALSIIIPENQLRVNAPTAKPVLSLAAPDAGLATWVLVFMLDPAIGQLDEKTLKHFIVIERGDGGRVALSARPRSLSTEWWQGMSPAVLETEQRARAAGLSDATASFWCFDEETRQIPPSIVEYRPTGRDEIS